MKGRVGECVTNRFWGVMKAVHSMLIGADAISVETPSQTIQVAFVKVLQKLDV